VRVKSEVVERLSVGEEIVETRGLKNVSGVNSTPRNSGKGLIPCEAEEESSMPVMVSGRS
jgi:hypothetical protein